MDLDLRPVVLLVDQVVKVSKPIWKYRKHWSVITCNHHFLHPGFWHVFSTWLVGPNFYWFIVGSTKIRNLSFFKCSQSRFTGKTSRVIAPKKKKKLGWLNPLFTTYRLLHIPMSFFFWPGILKTVNILWHKAHCGAILNKRLNIQFLTGKPNTGRNSLRISGNFSPKLSRIRSIRLLCVKLHRLKKLLY